ncbi:hypothetical protein BgAZ_208810 [Babesia gibsoni]|uniref:BRCT domain-containing protein n=1 Tax=Babesia gibsoni TaxID=33632 RepID=A0AAD8PES5_BABGI|nr:hypothetical protein BgAZ_208810 [Babesia gibsoni]
MVEGNAGRHNMCRHVSYIQSSFLSKVLKLEESSVVNGKKHECFVQTCPGKSKEDLKEFYLMGDPPLKTYYPMNYIGIGLHHAKDVDTKGWYTAYVPLHFDCFGRDVYNVKRALIRIIDGGVLWIPENVKTNILSTNLSDGPHKEYKNDDHTTYDNNIFSPPFQPAGVSDASKYVFATPSCIYATMKEVASSFSFDGLPVDLRIIIEVLVRPASYLAVSASIGSVDGDIDCCFPNEAIEWYIENTKDLLPQRILFRILKKEVQLGPQQSQATPASSPMKVPVDLLDTRSHVIELITVIPSSSLQFITESNFQSLREIFSSNSREDAVTFQEAETVNVANKQERGASTNGTPIRKVDQHNVSPLRRYNWDESSPCKVDKQFSSIGEGGKKGNKEQQFLNVKFKWSEQNNKIVFYFKSLINTRWLQWDSDSKLWRVDRVYMYECVRYATYLGLKVSDKVLFAVWSWLKALDMRGLGEVFSRGQMIRWLATSNIWSFQRINISVVKGYNPVVHKDIGKGMTPSMQALNKEHAETVEINMIPFNKEVMARFKERNSRSIVYVWQKQTNTWVTGKLKSTLEDLLAVLPSLKEVNQNDTYLSSRGINLRDINLNNKRKNSGQLPLSFKRVNREKTEADDDDDEQEFATVTNLLITVAGKTSHLMRLKDKIRSVVEKVQPPASSISASGKIISGGAGTGGIEFVENPRGVDEWNKVSFCVVPDEENGELPVDQYDSNLLSSLVAEVFIVKESAIDYLLRNFRRWPGPKDTVSYETWNKVITKNEPRCWGGYSFDGRQHLAQTRLFCEEDFFITGGSDNNDAMLCKLLIELGNGTIVEDAKDAEYVIITDKLSEEAQELHRLYGNNDEDLISKTHGARHSTLVTPKFIYDCILQWKLQRPTKSHGHMAF